MSTVYYPNRSNHKRIFSKKFPELIYEGAPPADADPLDYIRFTPKGMRLS